MIRRARIAPLAAGALLLACAAIEPGSRLPYNYALPAPVDGLTFHWPVNSLPVRIYVANSGDMQHAVDGGIAEWESNAPYGEFRAVIVSDAANADVVVRSEAPHPPSARFPDIACDSKTSWAVFQADSTLALPFRVSITAHTGFTASDVSKCFELMAVHEVGHIIGLISDSDDPADVMYPVPTATHLTPRDRATFMELYHRASGVKLPASRK